MVFYPNILIEKFEDLNFTLGEFLYENADTQPLSTNMINYSTVRFIVNQPNSNLLPVPSNFYCALYCNTRDPVTE